MKVFVPPIKSQGIKTKLVPWIMSNLPEVHGRWIEPFMGTGVVGFNSGFKEAIFGDFNPHLIRFYEAVKQEVICARRVKEFLSVEAENLKNAADNGYAHYRLVRDRFNKDFQPLDFLFLSRAGFNGMIRFSKKGNWNIPFCKKPDRFRQAYITKIVNQVSSLQKRMKPKWQFIHQSFEDTIAMAKESDLIYCDPPYLGRHSDYYNSWNETHEALLFKCLSETKAQFILSTWHSNAFRENTAIASYWNRFHMVTREHFYHAGAKEENRRMVTEALVMNFTPPKVEPDTKTIECQMELV